MKNERKTKLLKLLAQNDFMSELTGYSDIDDIIAFFEKHNVVVSEKEAIGIWQHAIADNSSEFNLSDDELKTISGGFVRGFLEPKPCPSGTVRCYDGCCRVDKPK